MWWVLGTLLRLDVLDFGFEGTVWEVLPRLSTLLQERIEFRSTNLIDLAAQMDMAAGQIVAHPAYRHDPSVSTGYPVCISAEAMHHVRHAFNIIDRDQSGVIDWNDFQGMGPGAMAAFSNVVSRFDENGDHAVTSEEFLQYFIVHALGISRISLSPGMSFQTAVDCVEHHIGQVIMEEVSKVIPELNENLTAAGCSLMAE